MVNTPFKNTLKKLISIDTERDLILQFAQKVSDKTHKILDVGCGYGRLLKPLSDKGFVVEGVEKNQKIVSHNQQQGICCHDFESFDKTNNKYHTIILSHIIEHFSPPDLVEFIDYYLNRLEPNGHLVIATPAISDYFYDDFDHVKPYLPTGLLMVFGEKSAQVQYYAKNRIRLKDLMFRVSPYSLRNFKSVYIKTKYTKLLQFINAMLGGLYLLSGKRIGKKDGWIGVFQKVE